jgi:putative spermidine/putrescine transport system substrate-binding protein
MTTSHKNKSTPRNASRRSFVKAAGVLSGAALLGAPAIVRAQQRKLTTRDPGGPFSDAFAQAFYEPFKKATGVTVVGQPSESEPSGMVKAMVESKNYRWDMAHLSNSTHLSLVKLGYLEPVAPKGGPGPWLSKIPETMRGEYIAGIDIYATVIAYREDMIKTPPQNWKDFFDLKGIPGLRGLRRNPFDTLEEALLADGVAPADLYPLDLDRAFKKLDEIKKEVGAWWENGAQSSQFLRTGEVDMLPIWNGRAQVAIDDGAPAKLVWNQALWTYEGFTILKGGPNVDLCREFIEFCCQPQQQAIFTETLAYGPTAPGAFDHISAERAALLPNNPTSFPHMTRVDSAYWGEHKDAVTDRFNSWLLA